jgi:hypothetical protein
MTDLAAVFNLINGLSEDDIDRLLIYGTMTASRVKRYENVLNLVIIFFIFGALCYIVLIFMSVFHVHTTWPWARPR